MNTMDKNYYTERVVSWVLLGISVFIPLAIIIPDHFPYLGMACSWALLSSVVFGLQKHRSFLNTALYISSMILSLFLVLRANPIITALNTLGLIYANATSMLYHRNGTESTPIAVAFSPLILFFQSLAIAKPRFVINVQGYANTLRGQKIAIPHTSIPSVVITIILMFIIVPLLSSANPIFANLVNQVLEFFNLEHLLETIASWISPISFIRLGVLVGLLFFLPKAATLLTSSSQTTHTLEIKPWNFSLLLPKIAVSIVLLVFFITQIQLYTADTSWLVTHGLTLSDKTREVFGQLTVVTLIIFALVYNDKNRSQSSKLLTYILGIQALFLTGMAYKSDYEYSSTWGFTHKRLYGFAVVFWTAGTLLLFLEAYVSNAVHKYFLSRTIVYSGIILIAINIANFDRLIYEYAKPSTHATRIDYEYMAYLSTDASSYQTLFPELVRELTNYYDSIDYNQAELIMPVRLPYTDIQYIVQVVKHKIEYLKMKYEHPDPRSFNWSEYQQYLQIQSLDTTIADRMIEAHDQKINDYYHRKYEENQDTKRVPTL